MRKFFLIPLLACFSCVMAWGEATEIVVNDFASLKTALSSEGTADVVKLGANITYGSELLNIQRSLTLDGNGFTITGCVMGNFSVSNDKHFNRKAIFAVNHGGSADAGLVITVQNMKLTHTGVSERQIPFVIMDGVTKFTLDNVETYGPNNDFQALLITGAVATPVQLVIKDSRIETKNYPMYILKPITASITNSYISGYCGMYFKYRWSSGDDGYGNTIGSRGSIVTLDACTLDCANHTDGESNNFAIFPIEDDGITLNLNNCTFNASTLGKNGDAWQRFVNLQYWKRGAITAEDVKVTVTGDNTHLYGVTDNKVIFNAWSMGQNSPYTGEGTGITKPTVEAGNFIVEFKGGTFSFNPESVKWALTSDNIPSQNNFNGGSGRITIDDTKYEVKEVSQGGVPVWRVVPKTTTSYNLNSDVPEEEGGAGDNPNTSFELSTGTTMELNQATTNAGYVEVKDNGSSVATTVKVGKVDNPGTPSEAKVDQTLVINNGLDVQGNSKVEVQAGSTLEIGEGGIVTSKPENIVIDADENGAASLIMNPAVSVNQTPNLTVKMTAKQIGRDSRNDYYWHRFAMPVQHIDTWTKEGALAPAVTYPTHLYGWSYDNNDWIKLEGGVADMVAFKGYTLTLASEEISGHEHDLLDVTYVFKGQLAGNTNNALQFSHEGYNFFGNSYTGYISIAKLIEQLTSNSKIQGTVWVWVGQGYEDISLNILAEKPGFYDDEVKEIAPMHTFVLKQNGTENANTTINYADAIWGNPRYGHSALPAPRRRVMSENGTMMRVVVTAANGQKDAVRFVEGANFSDAFENGYDASKFMNANNINVFATVNGEEFGTVASDNLNGKTITINTNSELAYTISFTNVNNEDYVLRDNVTGQVINIEEGATYEFAAQPNSTIANRFEIVSRANMPTAIENTEVKANVKGIYTIMGQYLGENFDILPAGVYVVDGVKIVK